MTDLFPKAVAPYAKAWVGFLGFVVAGVLVAWAEAPHWLTIVSAGLTAAGVYLTPNSSTEEGNPDPFNEEV